MREGRERGSHRRFINAECIGALPYSPLPFSPLQLRGRDAGSFSHSSRGSAVTGECWNVCEGRGRRRRRADGDTRCSRLGRTSEREKRKRPRPSHSTHSRPCGGETPSQAPGRSSSKDKPGDRLGVHVAWMDDRPLLRTTRPSSERWRWQRRVLTKADGLMLGCHHACTERLV